MTRPRARGAALVLVASMALAACTADDGDTLTVLAASSLTDAFEAIARDVEARHDVTVRLGLAGSHQLATQVLDGAPADVYASADPTQMARVVDAGLAEGPPAVFAHNTLVVAVHDRVRTVTSLADLADPGVAVVLAAEEVPAGRYARQALDALGLEVAPVSLEPSVRAVLAKVVLGEADAGIVYASDLVAAEADVHTIEVPAHLGPTADYPIVALRDAPHPDLAATFVAHVRSPAGRARLAAHGFRVDQVDR